MFEVSALQHIFKLLYECKIIQDIFLSCVFLHRVKESLFFETIDYISDRFFKRFFFGKSAINCKMQMKTMAGNQHTCYYVLIHSLI